MYIVIRIVFTGSVGGGGGGGGGGGHSLPFLKYYLTIEIIRLYSNAFYFDFECFSTQLNDTFTCTYHDDFTQFSCIGFLGNPRNLDKVYLITYKYMHNLTSEMFPIITFGKDKVYEHQSTVSKQKIRNNHTVFQCQNLIFWSQKLNFHHFKTYFQILLMYDRNGLYAMIDAGNGLTPNMWQASIWTDNCVIDVHIHTYMRYSASAN